jgi:hypothetical protein
MLTGQAEELGRDDLVRRLLGFPSQETRYLSVLLTGEDHEDCPLSCRTWGSRTSSLAPVQAPFQSRQATPSASRMGADNAP